jgi:hypothetical protein
MGIFDTKKKIIVFTPRKVGSTTVENIFEFIVDNDIGKYLYKHFVPLYFKECTENIDDYIKIIIIREPKEMIISWFWWINRNKFKNKNKSFIINLFKKNYKNYLEFNKDFFDNNIKYDYILHTENLKEELLNLIKKLELDNESFNLNKYYEIMSDDKVNKRNIRDKNIKTGEFIDEKIDKEIMDIYNKFDIFKLYYKK